MHQDIKKVAGHIKFLLLRSLYQVSMSVAGVTGVKGQCPPPSYNTAVQREEVMETEHRDRDH